MNTRKNKQSGFSLIELLIVVAIILVIAAIAIPNLLKSKTAGDQGATTGMMRTINTALTVHTATFGAPPATIDLAGVCHTPPDATGSCLLDKTMAANLAAGNTVSRYTWTYSSAVAPNGAVYTLKADPDTTATGSTRHFYVDSFNTIHFNDGAPAGATDPTL